MRKFCPLISTPTEYIYCFEGSCAFWNECAERCGYVNIELPVIKRMDMGETLSNSNTKDK